MSTMAEKLDQIEARIETQTAIAAMHAGYNPYLQPQLQAISGMAGMLHPQQQQQQQQMYYPPQHGLLQPSMYTQMSMPMQMASGVGSVPMPYYMQQQQQQQPQPQVMDGMVQYQMAAGTKHNKLCHRLCFLKHTRNLVGR